MQTDIYRQLAEHLDHEVIVGAPVSPALLGILEILFPDEEAEVGARLPFQNKTLAELEALYPDKSGRLSNLMDRMVERGTVFTAQKPGKDRIYRLLPSVVGWAETPYWAGKESETVRRLAPLWLKYREEAFGAELARGVPTMRVIPVSRSLKDESMVLPFDDLKPLVEAASYHAVGNCPCRQMKRYIGEGCDHSLETCLHFGAMGRFMVERGLARKIDAEEALSIVAKADEEGLVHIVENMQGHASTVCNCCGCCCVFINTKKKFGHHTLSRSNYVAQVDADQCAQCGVCAERCPMNAAALTDDGPSAVDPEMCIGCGACTSTCPTEAIRLIQRASTAPPPDFNEFLALRYKA